MHRISLGALIIALGMLVDNAIVVTEGILIGVQQGRKKLNVAKEIVSRTKWPLLGGTLVGIIAFAPIGFAPGSTAEYTGDLFWVILISLLFSWVFALTLTPLFCDWLFKEASGASEEQTDGAFARTFKAFTRTTLRLRWGVVACVVGLFFVSMWGFQFVKSGFFPASTTPQIAVDFWLPEGSDIETTNAEIRRLEAYISGLEGVETVQSLVGGGALRFMLIYNFESQNPAYAQILLKVDDYRKIPELMPVIQSHVDENYPNAQAKVWRFVLGPGGGSKIEATFQGPDPVVLRRLANEAKAIMAADGRALSIKDNWRQPVSVIEPIYDEARGRQLGISREDFANALATNFSGQRVGVYREGDTLLPIISRAPEDERLGIASLYEIRTLSSSTGRVVPLSQVMDGARTTWRNAQIRRENRVWTITAQCDPYPDELASDLLARLQDPINGIQLPEGYSLRWDGEIGDSTEANENLAKTIPFGLLAMVLVVVVLFNALRQPLVIWLVVPLSIHRRRRWVGGDRNSSGVYGDTRCPFAVWPFDQERHCVGGSDGPRNWRGKTAFRCSCGFSGQPCEAGDDGVLDHGFWVSSLCSATRSSDQWPVVLVFGLTFATLLTLVVVPVLYSIVMNVRSEETAA